MSARPPEHEWFNKAEQDLEMARRAMEPGNPLPAMACYHAQQCPEKYLKGYLISQLLEFRCVHDLVYLTQQCLKRQPAFAELLQTARILMQYGAGIRYPIEDFADPSNDEAIEAIGLAESVATFVKQKL